MENMHQELILKDKKALSLNAVVNILDFSELEMTIETQFGTVVIEGEDMKIESLSKDDGIVCVVGRIEGFYYKKQREKKNLFSKVLG
jgi:sporulation protein YabP